MKMSILYGLGDFIHRRFFFRLKKLKPKSVYSVCPCCTYVHSKKNLNNLIKKKTKNSISGLFIKGNGISKVWISLCILTIVMCVYLWTSYSWICRIVFYDQNEFFFFKQNVFVLGMHHVFKYVLIFKQHFIMCVFCRK